jgi:hypothetical protein
VTLLGYLQSLLYSDGSSVLVSRGALSTEEEGLAVASPNPYVLLFGLPDATAGRFFGGGKEMVTVLDCVLEQRPVGGLVPDIAEIERLYHLVGDAPLRVDELIPGVPLIARLEYVGGYGRPEQKHGTKDWLMAGLSFEATFQTNY